MNKKQLETYLENPCTCPYCGSDDLVGREIQINYGVARQDIDCDCGESWTDKYLLVDVEAL